MTVDEPHFREALEDLARFLKAIEPYLDTVVLGGGWVPYFYRHLQLESVPPHGPLLTTDFDLVVPSVLPSKESGTIHDQLTAGEFVTIRNREPPVVFYQHRRWGEDDLAPVYGELLTPLTGSLVDRSGNPKTHVWIQKGVVAQPLRYLDLLLHEPLSIESERVESLPLDRNLIVSVANPAAYVLQKALALEYREKVNRPKDFAYIFEVAVLWNFETLRLQEMTRSIVQHSGEWKKWARRGVSDLFTYFEDEYSEGPTSVEQEFRKTADGDSVSAERVARIVRPFLESAFA